MIIDHHKDSGFYPDAKRLMQFPVGSCASLVVGMLQVAHPALLREASVCVLLQSAILIDTLNLEDATKTTETDMQALAVIDGASPITDRAMWTKSLSDERLDLSGFTLAQILRKDLKYARAHGKFQGLFAVASVKVSLAEQGVFDSPAELEQFLTSMGASAAAEHLTGFFALCEAPESRKHIVACIPRTGDVVWTDVERHISAGMAAGGSTYGGIAVQGGVVSWPIEVKQGAAGCSFILFDIDGAASRKQVLPFLKDVLGKCQALPAHVGMDD